VYYTLSYASLYFTITANEGWECWWEVYCSGGMAKGATGWAGMCSVNVSNAEWTKVQPTHLFPILCHRHQPVTSILTIHVDIATAEAHQSRVPNRTHIQHVTRRNAHPPDRYFESLPPRQPHCAGLCTAGNAAACLASPRTRLPKRQIPIRHQSLAIPAVHPTWPTPWRSTKAHIGQFVWGSTFCFCAGWDWDSKVRLAKWEVRARIAQADTMCGLVSGPRCPNAKISRMRRVGC
jgi:hypothetical protein